MERASAPFRAPGTRAQVSGRKPNAVSLGQAKLFGLLRGAFCTSGPVCTRTTEKICWPLGLRGKPGRGNAKRGVALGTLDAQHPVGNMPLCRSGPGYTRWISGGKPNFSDCYEGLSVLRALCAHNRPKRFVGPSGLQGKPSAAAPFVPTGWSLSSGYTRSTP